MKIHVLLAGQFDNVGDTMHRRVLLDWLRPHGTLHLMVGQAPDSFLSGLGLNGEEVLHRSVSSWGRTIDLVRGPSPVLAYNPGEMTLGRRRALREAALEPLRRRVVGRGGEVIRIGVACGDDWTFSSDASRRVLARAMRQSTVLAWREQRSAELFGRGDVIPDLAFMLGAGGAPDRDTLAVTMRFDRHLPSPAWFDALRQHAERHRLRIVVTSQVRRDNPRTEELAADLGGEAQIWSADVDHVTQEKRVRDVYERSQLIVSDRLHALIAGCTEGAVPVALSPTPSRKVGTHFDVLGLKAAYGIEGMGADHCGVVLAQALEDKPGLNSKIAEARRRLETAESDVRDRLQRLFG